MRDTSNNWYVFYTRPHAEKVVHNELLKRQYDVFLPMVKTFRLWKNRQKGTVYKVLFPGYIFVKTIESEIYDVLYIRKIVRCIKCGDRPAVVPGTVISCIKIMLEMGQEVFTSQDFTEGEHVRVISGPLTGYEGILVKRKGKTRFCIELNHIRQCACIDISASMLEKIR